MPDFRPMNLGNVLSNVEQIKGARIRNRIGQMQTEEMENQQQNRQKRQQIMAMVDDMPGRIDAMKAEGMYDEAFDLQNQYLQIKKNGMVIADGMLRNVTPETWTQMRGDLIRQGAIEPYEMPTNYSQEWLQNKYNKAKADYKVVTETYGSKDGAMKQDYRVIEGQREKVGDPYPAYKPDKEKAGGRGTAGGLKAADSNAIANATADMFGGIYDPQTGRIGGIDPKETSRVAAIQARAEELYMKNPGMGHRMAANEAAREAGIDIQRLGPTADPLNLLQ